ncbi:MAG: hypothetical protein WBN94_09210 [Methanothrix sp.]
MKKKKGKTKTFIRYKRQPWAGVGNGCDYYRRVASGPADIGNIPGNNGRKLQGLALELRNAAQIDPLA